MQIEIRFSDPVVSTAIADITSTDHVCVLDQSSFPAFVEGNTMVLISSVHKLLPNCAKFIPIFERAAQAMQNSDVQFARINCLESATICRNFQLTTYPTAVLFQRLDNSKVYHVARREEDSLAYLTRHLSPIVSTITVDTLQDFKQANDVVVIGYLSPNGKKSHEALAALAAGLRDDFLFGVTCDGTLARAEKVEIPSIGIYKKSDKERTVLDYVQDTSVMAPLVKTAGRPLVVEFLPELHDGYFKEGLPLGYIFTATPEDKARISKVVQPLAKKFKGQVIFGTVDKAYIGRFHSLADYFWFQGVNYWPSFTIREPIKNLRFPFDPQQVLSEKELNGFVEAYLAGKLKPTIKSEPVPDEQRSPLLTVVALSYDEIVMNEKKDVLLQFCTSWCPFCRAFRPEYEDFARLYASDEILKNQVTIGTMDAEANEFPDRDIRGFPWFKLYPADSKDSPLLYVGPRTPQAMAEFIRDNGTHHAMPGVPKEI